MVYAPGRRRGAWQIGTCVGVLVVLVAILITKDITLGSVTCQDTLTGHGSCFGLNR
jgi:hypothetical protein